MTQKTIEQLRDQIDDIDRQILRLLNQRMSVSQQIGQLKASDRQDPVDPAREERILKGLASWNTGPLTESTLRAVYREIFSGSRALQAPVTVAFLGPQGTYTHQAAVNRFGSSASLMRCSTVTEVFEQVASGQVEFGVVPVENSIEGSVRETLDLLMTSSVNVCGEISVRISHALMNLTGRIDDIRVVISHPQALAQCRRWLAAKLPGIPLQETSSTAAAAEKAVADPHIGALANETFGLRIGLKLIARGIQDKSENITRFLILGSVRPAATGNDRTLLICWAEDRPGALFRVLEPFAEHGINLSRIESRPDRGAQPWKYAFFLDADGHRDDPRLTACLEELSQRHTVMKILGSFPAYSVSSNA